jgi:hypothetical protein
MGGVVTEVEGVVSEVPVIGGVAKKVQGLITRNVVGSAAGNLENGVNVPQPVEGLVKPVLTIVDGVANGVGERDTTGAVGGATSVVGGLPVEGVVPGVEGAVNGVPAGNVPVDSAFLAKVGPVVGGILTKLGLKSLPVPVATGLLGLGKSA